MTIYEYKSIFLKKLMKAVMVPMIVVGLICDLVCNNLIMLVITIKTYLLFINI